MYSREKASNTRRNTHPGKSGIETFLDLGLNDVMFEDKRSNYSKAEEDLQRANKNVKNLINELELKVNHDETKTQ